MSRPPTRSTLPSGAAGDDEADADVAAPRDHNRTVLVDREAVEDETPPPLPSFQRAGSQPDGSQRAGG